MGCSRKSTRFGTAPTAAAIFALYGLGRTRSRVAPRSGSSSSSSSTPRLAGAPVGGGGRSAAARAAEAAGPADVASSAGAGAGAVQEPGLCTGAAGAANAAATAARGGHPSQVPSLISYGLPWRSGYPRDQAVQMERNGCPMLIESRGKSAGWNQSIDEKQILYQNPRHMRPRNILRGKGRPASSRYMGFD